MRIAEWVIERLAREVSTCFLVYGGAISDLVDAIPGRMNYVVTQHEQAAGFAAEGYAKASLGLGLAIGTSGPGGGNLVTPIQNCFYDSTPCLFLTGQVGTKFMRPTESLRQLGFQETPITEIVRPITKYAVTIKRMEDVAYEFEKAIFLALDGRPGPVLIDLPNDVQRLLFEPHAQKVFAPVKAPYRPREAEQFLIDLSESKRPGILVGGGAYKSKKEIGRFAEKNGIPVFRTWNAQDVITDDHPCYAGTVGTYGGPGRNFGIQNTDLLLALGCRLSGRITGAVPESFARGAKLYVVDVDLGLLTPDWQPRKADVNVHASVEEFLDALA